jgi:hypothetical protein
VRSTRTGGTAIGLSALQDSVRALPLACNRRDVDSEAGALVP